MSACNDNYEADDLDGNVYLIASTTPRAVKIGYTTKDPRARLRQLQTGSPSELILLGWCPGNRSLEKEMHGVMAPYRLSGEWFRVDHGPEWSDAMRGLVTIIRINNHLTGFRKEFGE